jgi:microcystin-dependent protein
MKRVVLLFCAVWLLAASSSAQRFLGSISLVPYNFPPQGSAFCDGQILPIAQYDALYALIGTTYGGDGQTTFALPDLRGRVIVGAGQAPSLRNYVIGQSGGEESVTLNVSQIPVHSHTALAYAAAGNSSSPSGSTWAIGSRLVLYSAATNLAPMAPGAMLSSGQAGPLPHDNMKPFLGLNYVIWLEGIYPQPN